MSDNSRRSIRRTLRRPSCMLTRPHPIAVLISSSCGPKDPLNHQPRDKERRTQTIREEPSHGEDDGKAAGASEKDVRQEGRDCIPRETDGKGQSAPEADVQCQPLPSGRVSGGWLAELREIP